MSQEHLIKVIDVNDSHGINEGAKHRAEISKFTPLTCYSWAPKYIDTFLLLNRWRGQPPISMSRPRSEIPFTGRHSGSPRTWSPPSSIVKLGVAPGPNYRDYEHNLSLRNEMDDAVHYLTSLSIYFVASDIDIFTSDHTLKMILKFVQGDETPFQILMQKIGKTLFLVEKSNSAKTKMSFSRSVQEACTNWPGDDGSLSHQRLVQYTFNGVRCLVRFEADGCLDKTDRLMAAALLSDMVRPDVTPSVQPDPVLQMNLQAPETTDHPDAFSAQLLRRPDAVMQASPKPPSTEYHWAQLESLAEARAEQKRLDAIMAAAAAEEALANPSPHPDSIRDEDEDDDDDHNGGEEYNPPVQRLKKPEPEVLEDSERSPIVQHIKYLEQYPIAQFCSIAGVESEVAQKYLDMAGGEFKRALDLYHDSQNDCKGVLLARFVANTKATLDEAKYCLKYCKKDYEKTLRFYAATHKHSIQSVKSTFKHDEREREILSKAIQSENAKGVPHSALFTLRCATEKSALASSNLPNDQLVRLWITRIPGVITAYYDAKATVSSITYTDIRPKIRRWEGENQETLLKLSALLKDLKNTVRKNQKMILSVIAKDKLEVRKASSVKYDVLSLYHKNRWLHHTREDDGEGNGEDDDDDEEGGTPSSNDDSEEFEDEDEDEEDSEEASETSSDWEK